ncbi:DUF1353 domain-containing protein [Candidatus Pacearchaeota archaeon]|nr:DUF1353 domain-containing protein [Candidatus Pacearchaeota archaeon]
MKNDNGVYFPILKPVRIPTKGKFWLLQVWIAIKTRRSWMVVEDFNIEVPCIKSVVKIPAGFVFDGASIPVIVQKVLFLKPTGILFLPALLHDFGYVYDCLLSQNHNIIPNTNGRVFFDKLFRKMGVWVNGMPIIDRVAWFGLFLGAGFPWRKRRKKNAQVFVDFPKQ